MRVKKKMLFRPSDDPAMNAIPWIPQSKRVGCITSANYGEGYEISRFCMFVVCYFVSKIIQKVVDGL